MKRRHSPEFGQDISVTIPPTKSRAAQIERFAEILYTRAPLEFYSLYDDAALRRLAQSAFEFLDAHTEEPVRVRVFNPEPATHGWWSPHTVIQVTLADRPFILDSIRELLDYRHISIVCVLHPILSVGRTAGGSIQSLDAYHGSRAVSTVAPAPSDVIGLRRESFMHWEIDRVAAAAARDQLATEIRACLNDVILVTDDFEAMTARVREVIATLEPPAVSQSPQSRKGRGAESHERPAELKEVQQFLEWLLDGNFVFLGYRVYEFLAEDGRRMIRVAPGSGLGVLRKEARSTYARPVPLDTIPPDLRARIEGGPLLLIAKTNAAGTVHRRIPMDYIGVKKLDADGHYAGERRFLGFFTSKANRAEASEIPVLRRKLQHILTVEQAIPGTHDYKEIVALFDSFAKPLLFESSPEELHQDIRAIMHVVRRDESSVHIRAHPMRRGIAAIVPMPRWRFSEDVRDKIQRLLEKTCHGTVQEFDFIVGEHDQTRLHFTLAADPSVLTASVRAALQSAVREITRSWQERLLEKLRGVHGEANGRGLHARYAAAFPPDYMAVASPGEAAADVAMLEALRVQNRPQVGMLNASRRREKFTIIKFYFAGAPWLLSEILPILNNFGLRVMEQIPVTLNAPGLEQIHIQQLFVQNARGEPLDVPTLEPLLAPALLAVASGAVGDGALNSLVVSAGMSIRDVDLLRACRDFAFQSKLIASRIAADEALTQNPVPTRELFAFFQAKFHPDERKFGPLDWRIEKRLPELKRLFLDNLWRVENLTHDRIFRTMLNIVEAAVRTNFYQSEARPIAVKFESARLDRLAPPRPLFEIYVHSARLEGCHLRAGRIARGGIRHSDRPFDFRTEILGLMKTQKVKNALIVPTGAKGGFVIKPRSGLSNWSPAPPSEKPAETLSSQYSQFISALLDVTDNIVAGRVVHPPRCVIYDGDDPYLVVAADKGTARLSDTANAVAAECDFWLGDAFASGGSRGYDHKALGITARGGWEGVKRHFREMGRDIQTQEFTAIGIGSMDGDVFGNGVLLSRKMKLLAAFGHRDIIIDPNPDPEISYRERERNFCVKDSWLDYDPKCLSPGGGIYKRHAKDIRLSSQARAMLGLSEETVDSETLIRAILRMKVDLFWNGGIGTYVKAPTETNADAEDAASDALRINADELGAAVVGEGGNLGFTQLGRIEYALRGGRLNTDAIDNSGGVDMSDHEVNLKILLAPLVKQGRLSLDERNRLLQEVTDDVVAAILGDNITQSLVISLDQIRSRAQLDDYINLMRALEDEGLLDRALERLPAPEELRARKERSQHLTRPELAVLLAYSKMWLKRELLERAGDFLDDPALEKFLVSYFPRAVAERFPDAPRHHQLCREIVATQLTNEITDTMGCAFVRGAVSRTRMSLPQLIQRWLALWENGGYRQRWNELLQRDLDGQLSREYSEMCELQERLRTETESSSANPKK
jgi:glutamate dehydrogenase